MNSKRFDAWSDRLLDHLGSLETLQLALLGFTLGSVGLGLSAVVARLSPDFMLLLAVVSVLTAGALTRTRLRGWAFGLVGALLGLLGLGLTVGQIGSVLAVLLGSLLPPLGQLLQKEPPDFSATVAAWQALGDRLALLAARFDNWFQGVNAHELVIDPMVTSILWGLALWLAAFWAIWWVRRRASALIGLLPAAALLGYNLFYTGSGHGITWLALTAGGILTLQASAGYGAVRQRWAAQRVEREEIEPRLALLVAGLVVGMILAGSLLPSIPLRRIANLIDTALHPPADQALARSLGLEQTPVGSAPPAVTATPLIRSGIHSSGIHPIGPGPLPDQSLVMFVAVDGYHPPPPNEYAVRIAQGSSHYYWRAQTYAGYNGRTWSADPLRTDKMAAGQSFRPDVEVASQAASTLVTQRVIRLQPEDTVVFAAGELLRLDQPASLLRRDSGEIVAVHTEAELYTASSRIQSPSVEQLRAAGSNYPASLRPYLELPDELPVRVLDLALNLTADQPTPYDQAAMLEAYLRQFPYSREVPAPPADRDAVDYFLFDLKTGYCDYYASALVVMARAAGLPARLVLGYSEGLYDPVKEAFVVRAANAHAWAEIYFPNIGWVEFEPTATQPRLIRPGQSAESAPQVDLPPPGREAALSIHLERTWLGRLILSLLGAAAVLAILPFLPLETWWLSLLPAERAFQTIFRRLYRRGRSLGIQLSPSRTPNDFALAFSAAMERPADDRRQALAASLLADLECLTRLYNRLLFSEHPPREEEKLEAIRAWANFRRGLRQVRRNPPRS